MKLLIRTDSGRHIGHGHAYRCRVLAKAFASRGWQVHVISRRFPDCLEDSFWGEQVKVHWLPEVKDFGLMASGQGYSSWLGESQDQDSERVREVVERIGGVDAIVVDHYSIDSEWESKFNQPKVVIDDLMNRRHNCDILLDQNITADKSVYSSLLENESTITLLGPEYALLRNEFFSLREKIGDAPSNGVLVSYGGIDSSGETLKAIEALDKCKYSGPVSIVLSEKSECFNEVSKLSDSHKGWELIGYTEKMAQLIYSSEFVMGACGTSIWERAVLSVPTLITTTADNQVEVARLLAKMGLAIYVGASADVGQAQLIEAIRAFEGPSNMYKEMSAKLVNVVGAGGALRVVDEVERLSAED